MFSPANLDLRIRSQAFDQKSNPQATARSNFVEDGNAENHKLTFESEIYLTNHQKLRQIGRLGVESKGGLSRRLALPDLNRDFN